MNGSEKTIIINNDSTIELKRGVSELKTEMHYNKVIVQYGSRSFIELEDGTKVWLNAGSSFAFPDNFSRDKREVFLKGEAYFEVSRDETKPFYVIVNGLNIKVLGTRFVISSYDNDEVIKTVLIEGKLNISTNAILNLPGKTIMLSPNQKALFNKEDKRITVMDEPDISLSTAWINGWFSFEKEPLLNVLNSLERYYNIKFDYDESFYSNDLISGKLGLKDSITDVMEVIKKMTRISYRIEKETIYIK